jgi:hypothetical protein
MVAADIRMAPRLAPRDTRKMDPMPTGPNVAAGRLATWGWWRAWRVLRARTLTPGAARVLRALADEIDGLGRVVANRGAGR